MNIAVADFNKYVKILFSTDDGLTTKQRARLAVSLRWFPMTIGSDVESGEKLIVQDLVILEMVDHLNINYAAEKE